MTRRIWVVGGVVAVAALLAGLVAGMATSTRSTAGGTAFLAAKADSNSWADKAGVGEGPMGTWEAEQTALRAFPGDSIPTSALQRSLDTFAKFKKAHGRKTGQWLQLGPATEARYPAFLDQFLGGGQDYDASGRVTALAIAPGCTTNKCRLYVGAAGGGVWTTDRALASNASTMNWKFITGSLDSNAVGSILIDPTDPSGDTVYLGTGEGNAAVDNEAGVGIYKSTDAGQTWSLVPGSDAFNQRAVGTLAIDSQGRLLAGVLSAVRGVCQTSQGCALSSASTTHPLAPIGLYRQTGPTFTRIFPGRAVGVNEVALDPTTPTTVYLADFSEGVWRSTSNGDPGTWVQIKSGLNQTRAADRATFALNTLPGGKTRMYVGIGNDLIAPASNQARFYRSDDVATGTPVFADLTTVQTQDYCGSFAVQGAQCWYDNVVYSPPGSPDVVYVGGAYDYDRVHGQNNGRALMLSTDAGATWHDMTLDKTGAGWLHPDHHALVTIPGHPLQWIDGNDGGLVRSNGEYVDGSAACSSRNLTASDLATCQTFLAMIPDTTASLNKGLPTLQFQSLSVDPAHPRTQLMGGTQDNGTFGFTGNVDRWPQIIYGDGGQSGFNAADDALRFNSFAGQASDVNFRDGDPRYWVVSTGPIVSSPESSLFYPPLIADPSKAFADSIFSGSQSVWRTQDWGGDQAFLEANCSEFTTSAANPACGDYTRIGPAGTTDLTRGAADYRGATRAGGNVAALTRASQDTGTLWAATTSGRLFVSDNANATDATSVTWTRLDSDVTTNTNAPGSPTRDITQIAIDPSNANRAYVAYSGYNVNTPTTPGHVFRVDRSGSTATWTDLSYNLDDLPVNGVALDSQTGDLYAATDFGVMMLPAGTTTWQLAASGMPTVDVTMLNIVPDSRVLYASTHGFGAWELNLSK